MANCNGTDGVQDSELMQVGTNGCEWAHAAIIKYQPSSILPTTPPKSARGCACNPTHTLAPTCAVYWAQGHKWAWRCVGVWVRWFSIPTTNSSNLITVGRVWVLWVVVTWGPPPPVNRMTDTTESITFPQLCWRVVIRNESATMTGKFIIVHFSRLMMNGNFVLSPSLSFDRHLLSLGIVNYFWNCLSVCYQVTCQLRTFIHLMFPIFSDLRWWIDRCILSYYAQNNVSLHLKHCTLHLKGGKT